MYWRPFLFFASGGANAPAIADADTPRQVGLYMGWSDVWNSSQGGVGYTAQNGGSNYTYAGTAQNMVLGNAPDVVIFQGSVNDVGTASATEQANALAAFRNVRTAYSSVPSSCSEYGPTPLGRAPECCRQKTI
jgi:hypothetical protein